MVGTLRMGFITAISRALDPRNFPWSVRGNVFLSARAGFVAMMVAVVPAAHVRKASYVGTMGHA